MLVNIKCDCPIFFRIGWAAGFGVFGLGQPLLREFHPQLDTVPQDVSLFKSLGLISHQLDTNTQRIPFLI